VKVRPSNMQHLTCMLHDTATVPSGIYDRHTVSTLY
jgi:hypothetical protein